MRFLKKLVLFCGITCTLFGLNCSSGSKNRPDNIVLIIIDTLRQDHLGCYGYDRIETPSIDGLAGEGIRFEEAFSHVPLTLPSIASILTSLTPHEHGVHYSEGYRLPDDVTTLAEALSSEGFRTAAFVSAVLLDPVFGIDQGFDRYDSRLPSRFELYQPSLHSLEPVYNRTQRRGEDVTNAAIEWIEKNNEERFFILLHYFDPHIPYDPPLSFVPDIEAGEYKDIFVQQVEFYDAEIEYTDHQIGLFLERLRELDLIDNTLIVFTSDHGEALGDKGEETHRVFLYESTIRVPLILSGAMEREGGKVISNPVRLIDIYPTILGLFQIDPPSEISGRSLVPLIDKGSEEIERPIYLETYANRLERGWSILRGVRVDNWKYIAAPAPELYNLEEDPGELYNLYATEADQAARLEGTLARLMDPGTRGERVEPRNLEKSLLERVRSLGYFAVSDEYFDVDFAGVEGADPKVAFPEFKRKKVVEELFRAALTLIASNQPDNAIPLLEKALELDPDRVECHYYLAEVFRLQGLTERGMEEINNVLRYEPENAEAYYTRGLIASQAGDPDLARISFEKAISLKPNHAQAYNNMGLIYSRNEDFDTAFSLFEKALEINPDLAQARANIGNIYSIMERSGDAVREWELALKLDPEMKNLHFFLGNAYYRDQEYDKALDHYESFLETDPEPHMVTQIRNWIQAIRDKMKSDDMQTEDGLSQ